MNIISAGSVGVFRRVGGRRWSQEGYDTCKTLDRELLPRILLSENGLQKQIKREDDTI